MLESPNADQYLSVKIWRILQWTISRKPKDITNVSVGSSETTRSASLNNEDGDIVHPSVVIMTMILIVYYLSSIYSVSCYCALAGLPFIATDPGKLYQHIIRFTSWPQLQLFKKHRALAHCNNVPDNLTDFRRKWKGVSGIYKITFLPFRMFTYYGSSSDLGMRFKYHYFNGAKQNNFLGLFLRVFGWNNFSITVVERCSREDLFTRENWYLSRFQPLLNVLMSAGMQPVSTGHSLLTRAKISAALLGRTDSEETRTKKSKSQMGALNAFYGKGPGIKALDKAAEMAGTKVYAYSADNFTLVNDKPFRSVRSTADVLPVSHGTLPTKLDTGKPFKGYYYFTSPQLVRPNNKP